MNNDTKLPAPRFILAAALACGLLLQSAAERPLSPQQPWSMSWRVDCLSGCALLLGAMVLLLLWRQRGQRALLSGLRRQLQQERIARQGAEESRRAFQSQLCQLRKRQEHIKQEERVRIARDIHDDLGQHLMALKIDVSMLHLTTRGAHPFVSHGLGLVEHHIDLTIKSLRAIINDLRPIGLEAGLKAAVEHQLAQFSRISAVRCDLHADHAVFEAGAGAAIDCAVFRILQESLSNIARHARATEVRIALQRDAQALSMTISDNGVGMAGGARRGCGLLGIGDRVAAVAGRLHIDSAPGRGTTVSVAIPLVAPLPATAAC
ncbi:MAG: sensor histidine kinase [Pseudomonadota bacterium]